MPGHAFARSHEFGEPARIFRKHVRGPSTPACGAVSLKVGRQEFIAGGKVGEQLRHTQAARGRARL